MLLGIYCLGLGGTFWLDDFGTLPPLAQWGQIDSWDKLLQFLTGGFAGPTGRPVSLLSFLVHGGVWPDQTWDYLLFNIACHLVTTYLFYVFLRSLVQWAGIEQFRWLPLLAAVIWAFHPLHVSTVLYIVQRMTVLSALFSLLAMIGYLSGRLWLQQNQLRKAMAWFVLGAAAALLALFSKENAILLPVQFLLIELLLLWLKQAKNEQAKKAPLLQPLDSWSRWLIIMVVIIPSLVVIWYLSLPLLKNSWLYLMEGREFGSRRGFTLFERLATQQRVVGDYLSLFFVPKAQTAGVFYDNYPVSKNLLEPVSGLIWLLVHVFTVVFAWCWRKKLPFLAFGVLWFYLGHWVESGTVMLEMKFEHRNYLPSMGLAIAIAASLICLPVAKKYKLTFGALIIGVCTILLILRVSLWGHPKEAVLVWAEENPRSIRAMEHAAMIYSQAENGAPVVERSLAAAIEVSEGEPITVLRYYAYMCPIADNIQLDIVKLEQKFKTSPLKWQASQVFEEVLGHMISRECDLPVVDFQRLLHAASANRYYKRTRYPTLFRDYEARAELALGTKAKALHLYLNQNYQRLPLELVMKQALWMASYGQQAEAAQHLRKGIKAKVDANAYLLDQAQDMLHKIEKDISMPDSTGASNTTGTES